MYTPRKLFTRRLLSYYRYQWKALRTLVDWVIALYVVIPAGIAAVLIYRSLWLEPPHWLTQAPELVYIVVFYLFIWSGAVDMYVEEGDMLLLYQRKRWLTRLRAWSAVYSVALLGIGTATLVALCAPALIHGAGMRAEELATLFFWLWSLKVLLAFLKQWLASMRWWLKWLLRIVFFVGGGVLLGYGLSLVIDHGFLLKGLLGAALIWAIQTTIVFVRDGSRFMEDVERHRKARQKLAGMIVGDWVKKKPVLPKKKPWLFAGSLPVYRRRRSLPYVMAETAWKRQLRDPAKLRMTLQLTGAGMAGLWLCPGPVRWLFFAGISLLALYWMRMEWRGYRDGDFLHLFSLPRAKVSAASEKAIRLMALPVMAVWALEAAWLIGLAWHGAGLLLLAVGLALWWFAAAWFAVPELNYSNDETVADKDGGN